MLLLLVPSSSGSLHLATGLHDVILVQREEGSFNQVNQPVSVPSENFHPHLGPCMEKSPRQAVTQQRRLLEPSMPRVGIVLSLSPGINHCNFLARHLQRQGNG
jgi:hypothetical protein